jgi:hypothetical protein
VGCATSQLASTAPLLSSVYCDPCPMPCKHDPTWGGGGRAAGAQDRRRHLRSAGRDLCVGPGGQATVAKIPERG